MMVKTSIEMTSNVGTMTATRQMIYRSTLYLLLHPEGVGHIDAEIASRIKTIEGLVRQVSEFGRAQDRLECAVDQADGKYLLRVDGQHFLPDVRPLRHGGRNSPLLQEVNEFRGFGQVGRYSLGPGGQVIH